VASNLGVRAVLLVLGLTLVAFAGDARGSGVRVEPSAPSGSLAVIANESAAGRGDSIAYTVWLNLTGAGSTPFVWVNLTFAANLTADAANASVPVACAPLAPWSWECGGLGSGSYAWSFTAAIRVDSAPGESLTTVANATTFSGTAYADVPGAAATVLVLGAKLSIRFTEYPVSVRPGERARIAVDVVSDPGLDDPPNETAYNVRLTVALDPWLLVDPDSNLSFSVAQLSPGSSRGLRIDAILAGNATIGARIGIRAILRYDDFNLRPIGPREEAVAFEVAPPDFVPLASVLVAVLAFVTALAGAVVVRPILGQRRITMDEVFLMHRNGILIQHRSRTPSLTKDDDIVASMLVAIQDFVRDSFRTEAALDDFSFGERSAAFVRGKHIVLAAILSRGDPRYLIPQLRAAADALEVAHGDALADWDGRIGRLVRAPEIMDVLLAGGYRAIHLGTGRSPPRTRSPRGR